METNIKTKQCTTCKMIKNIDEFSLQKDKNGKYYPRGECKKCKQIKNDKYNEIKRQKTEILRQQKEQLKKQETVRTCRKCGVEKPLTKEYFHSNPNKRTKEKVLSYVCLDCKRLYYRESNRRKNPKLKSKIRRNGTVSPLLCGNCKQLKPATKEFFYWIETKSRKYFSCTCIECSKEQTAEYRKKHPEITLNSTFAK